MASFQPMDVRPLLGKEAGFIRVPFDTSLASAFREQFQLFLERHAADRNQERFTAYVGDQDPDIGLVRKEGWDHKYYWHHIDPVSMLSRFGPIFDHGDQDFFRAASECYARASVTVTVVLLKLALAGYPMLLRRFTQVPNSPTDYNQHVLRGLSYDEGTAGVVHLDRALCTLHLGDVGGHLYYKSGDIRIPIETRPGEAILFFGIKAEILTKGRVRALWHGSETNQGERRQAEVFFAHGTTEKTVDSWRDYVKNPQAYWE